MGSAENERLSQSSNNRNWKKWGPYISDRQWGTIREDYSPEGNAWNFVNHDLARSYAFRWGEEGIAGFCDVDQILCLAPAFWNGNDSILKERLFGLTNGEGNHGEDVKELYFHLDSSPRILIANSFTNIRMKLSLISNCWRKTEKTVRVLSLNCWILIYSGTTVILTAILNMQKLMSTMC